MLLARTLYAYTIYLTIKRIKLYGRRKKTEREKFNKKRETEKRRLTILQNIFRQNAQHLKKIFFHVLCKTGKICL